MAYREPLVPHSNWWMYFVRSGSSEKNPVRKAAEISFYACKYFKEEIKKLEQDCLSNGTALCMRQYGRMFGYTRIPLLKFDSIYENKLKSTDPHFLLIININSRIAMFKICISEISTLDQMKR